MPTPGFVDGGSYNIKDADTGNFVGKLHVESAAADIAGGRSYIMHWVLVKSAIPDSGWGVWTKPTTSNNKQLKWEGSGETLANVISWMNDPDRKGNIRYVVTMAREQDTLP